jgi:hypothetical protein
MKHAVLALAIAALAFPASALGKGPSGASIDGPGSGGGITVSGGGESGGTPLGDLTQQAGFFAATFGQEPNPLLASRPNGNLGPKYTITYTVPGPNNELDEIRQDVYPYANPAPVTYMEPGQAFFGTERTRGGWFKADPALRQTLVAAGLPRTAPGSATTSGSSDFPTALVTLLTASLLVAMATALLIRRWTRPAAA